MVHRPKSVIGYVIVVLLTIGVVYLVVSLLGALSRLGTLSSPLVLGALAVIVLASLLVFAWRRRVEAERERAWIGSFSFAEVVERRRAEEALSRVEGAAG